MIRRLLLPFAVLAIAVSVFFGVEPAAAATYNMPNQDDFADTVGDVKLLVGNQSNGQGILAKTSIVKVYSTSPTITVNIAHFGQCYYGSNSYNYDWDNGPSPGATRYELFATDADEAKVGSALSSASNGNSCSSDRGLTATTNRARSQRIGHTNYYVFEFVATMTGSGFGWNSFSLSVPSGNHIGFSDQSGDTFALKSRFNESVGPTYSTYTLRFAPACEITSSVSGTLSWFDADQGEPNQRRTLSFDLIDDTTGQKIIAGRTSLGDQNERRSQTVTLQPGHKYRWVWYNVSSYNGIQFQMPFDSIYYNDNCQSTYLRPNSTVDKAVLSVPDTATFTHTVQLTGGSQNGTVNYQVSRTRDGAVVATQNGTTSFTGVGTYTARVNTFTSAPGDEGHRICERITLSGQVPAGITLQNNPSTEVCTVVAKTPYVHFSGNDVWAGGGFPDINAACNGQSKIQTVSQSLADGTTAGSMSEYGAFALGRIIGFGSAGQPLIGPAGQLLSFSNMAPLLGQFGAPQHCISDYFSRFSTAQPLATSAVDVGSQAAGNWHIAGNAQFSGTMPIGKKLVFVVDGDVTITGNLNYPATYGSSGEIPSLIILARGSMTVQSAVTQINGMFVTKGQFNTCDPPPGNLSSSICNLQLVVNGPVVAQRLNLVRTYGASGSTPADRKSAAEIFNFSPEFYISNGLTNSSSGFIREVDRRDLPPRF